MKIIRYSVLFFGLVGSFFLAGITTFASADDRDLPGVDIITREERGADESLRYLDNAAYARYLKDTKAYQDWLNGIGIDRGGKFAARKKRAEINNKRRALLIESYPNDIATDSENDEHDGNELLRVEEFKEDKTKIVIHHTAGSQVYDSEEASRQGVVDIYKFHAHNRGRGDIGYNFLIDPFGNIYEGRAGGKGVVAAHTDWNNTSTIGIALMGNFDVEEPTAAARRALTKLTTVLAVQYNINPDKQQPYFTAIEEDPWLEVHTHDSIIGHQDAKNTACPGDHVYDKIPALKRTVAGYVAYFRKNGIDNFNDIEIVKGNAVFADSDTANVSLRLSNISAAVTCSSADTQIRIIECTPSSNGVDIKIGRLGFPASGWKTIIISDGDESYLGEVMVVREEDLDELAENRKEKYEATNGATAVHAPEEKMMSKVNPSDIPDMLDRTVDVLLYDLTALYDVRDMRCETGCDVTLDDQVIYGAKIVNVVEDKTNDSLNVFIDLKKHTSTKVHVKNNSLITVTNYDRGVSGYPMNLFRGDITIQKDDYNHLDYGRINRYVIINSVSLDDYLAGIGETSELQHEEKLKAMALLVKNYALFYIEGKNPHDSLPTDGSYNAVDDPRIFQKYLGAGRESYGQKWHDALRATDDEIITYDGYLPILPYFHCSAGFTRSGREYFGRTDTPWLQSKIDVMTCESGKFEGHGVGMSGDGAERLAQKGVGYKEILRRYYEGIDIDTY